jgi:hypothetical protein
VYSFGSEPWNLPRTRNGTDSVAREGQMPVVIGLYGLLFLVDLAPLVVALIDCLSTDGYANGDP